MMVRRYKKKRYFRGFVDFMYNKIQLWDLFFIEGNIVIGFIF